MGTKLTIPLIFHGNIPNSLQGLHHPLKLNFGLTQKLFPSLWICGDLSMSQIRHTLERDSSKPRAWHGRRYSSGLARQGCWGTRHPFSLLLHPSGKSPFVRNVLSQRRKRDVIMSLIMNSEGNKEFKEKSSGDDQRAEAFRIV